MNTPIKGMKVEVSQKWAFYRIETANGDPVASLYLDTPNAKALAHQFAASGEVMEACCPTLSKEAWASLVELAEAFDCTEDTEGPTDGASIRFLIDREVRIRAALALSKGES